MLPFYRFLTIFCALFLMVPPPAAMAEPQLRPIPQKRPAFARDTIAIQAQDGGRHRMLVEIARTPDEQAYGLMKKKALPGTEGMLFLYQQPQRLFFWMKDTLIPLDILFIDAAGRITHIVPQATPGALDYIGSRGPAKAVLEIRGGMAERWNIRAGDRILYQDFPQ